MIKIAIIGAGLSGLTAAILLKDQADITLFEKSRGVGGRMSTRRADPYQFDHGAQFFTAQSEAFKAFINPMLKQGIIECWDARFVEFQNRKIVISRPWNNHYPHYVGVPGMNAMAKFLSQDLKLRLGVRVQTMKQVNKQWHLEDEQGIALGKYDWVISSVPAEQASDLLPTTLPFYSQVNSLKMQSCFSLMLGFEQELPLEFDAALVRSEAISWISSNSSKPGRNKAFGLLVHSSNQWAVQHIADDLNQVMDYLRNQTSEIIGYDLNQASHQAIHRWRYANIDKQSGPSHFKDTKQHVGVCGDWFIQGRVEAAFTSGFELAKSLIKII